MITYVSQKFWIFTRSFITSITDLTESLTSSNSSDMSKQKYVVPNTYVIQGSRNKNRLQDFSWYVLTASDVVHEYQISLNKIGHAMATNYHEQARTRALKVLIIYVELFLDHVKLEWKKYNSSLALMLLDWNTAYLIIFSTKPINIYHYFLFLDLRFSLPYFLI